MSQNLNMNNENIVDDLVDKSTPDFKNEKGIPFSYCPLT